MHLVFSVHSGGLQKPSIIMSSSAVCKWWLAKAQHHSLLYGIYSLTSVYIGAIHAASVHVAQLSRRTPQGFISVMFVPFPSPW